MRAIVDEPWQAKEDLKHARALIEQQRATIDDLLSSIQWLELRRNDAAWAKVREVIEAIANARPASREGQGGV